MNIHTDILPDKAEGLYPSSKYWRTMAQWQAAVAMQVP